MSDTIKKLERDGWQVRISTTPDYDYRPGYDDDLYPRVQDLVMDPDTGAYPPDGFLVDYRGGTMHVSGEEVARLVEVSGADVETLKADARAIGGELLSWVGVVVTASRGSVVGTASLWGVEHDLREDDPDAFALETAEHHDLIGEAIDEAARAACGELATLALSY